MAFEGNNQGGAVPRHVGIIMDGNGRWAAERGRPRGFGHKAGMEAVRRAVRAAGDLGVPCLTLYAFSSENWSRPQEEIQDLFGLMKFFINRDLAELCASGVRIRILGDRDGVPPDIGKLIETAESKSRDNTRLELNIAFNYGARDEIRRAFQRVLGKVRGGDIDLETLSEADIAAELDTAGLRVPDPDLIVRTSGEMRLSNFMLWQSAYAELVFLPCMWPDFDQAWFAKAIEEYASRSRKYGGIAAARDIAL